MRAMVYRGPSGCRVIVQFHKPAWSRQPRLLSRTFARPSPACQAARRAACATTAVNCSYATKVTIYNCRNCSSRHNRVSELFQ